MGDNQGAAHRAYRQCRLQQAQSLRADVQNVLGIDRQQRRGAAKEHGKQIQRNDPKNNAVIENEAESTQKTVK